VRFSIEEVVSVQRLFLSLFSGIKSPFGAAAGAAFGVEAATGAAAAAVGVPVNFLSRRALMNIRNVNKHKIM
jgi:hypothetical protein